MKDVNIFWKFLFLSLSFFLFSLSEVENMGERQSAHTHTHSSELNAFFKVELNFVQNPPRAAIIESHFLSK